MKPRLYELQGKFVKESYENQSKAGRYHPATVFVFSHPKLLVQCRAVLSAGTDDCVTMWFWDDMVYSVSTNRSLGYVGVEMFYFTTDVTRIEAGQEDQLFYQNEEDAKEVIGKHLWDYTERTIARRLIELCGEHRYGGAEG